jgi:thiamine kinase-like enzyme
LTLCHGDTNIRNMIRRSGSWAAVDWEYSGWGDPAFEIATLVTHAAHVGVAPVRWAWVIDTYAALSPDAGVAERIRVYVPLMLVWWVARCARILYEWPRGADRRLAERPAGWQADIEAKYHQYLALAARWLP